MFSEQNDLASSDRQVSFALKRPAAVTTGLVGATIYF
jgi:hypothetical protein